MKKLFILLFLPFLGFSQAVFDEGIQNTAAATNNTPAYIVTHEANNVYTKTPAAIIEKTTNKISTITTYSEVLYPNEKAVHDGLDTKLNISDLHGKLLTNLGIMEALTFNAENATTEELKEILKGLDAIVCEIMDNEDIADRLFLHKECREALNSINKAHAADCKYTMYVNTHAAQVWANQAYLNANNDLSI